MSRVMNAYSLGDGDLEKIRYPVIGSTKVNGVRAHFLDGILKSRTDRVIPNFYIRRNLELVKEIPLDGELVCGNSLEETRGNIQANNRAVPFTYYVFDVIRQNLSYSARLVELENNHLVINHPFIKIVPAVYLYTPEDVIKLFQENLKDKYPSGEGIILRSPTGLYKSSRSTLKEQYLLKMKGVDEEIATVIGVSKFIEGGVEKNAVGSLQCVFRGKTFYVGSGFSHEDRYNFFNRDLINKQIRFSYLPACSKDGVPSQPVFKGFHEDVSN